MNERFMRHNYGASGYAPIPKDSVAVNGIWLRSMEGKVQVLAEFNGAWHLLCEYAMDGCLFSEIQEPGGIRIAPLDPVTAHVGGK